LCNQTPAASDTPLWMGVDLGTWDVVSMVVDGNAQPVAVCLDCAAAHLSAVAQGDDVDAIEQAIKNVDKQTQEFAARRMDQSVRR
ncbi:hypothetical protein MJL48_32930, partial [Salmonella enterica subsp. enterica serovar Kentucky]|nr:hypothetical protein [Salmonella enterica subsp. enterica serovar Kentucky]